MGQSLAAMEAGWKGKMDGHEWWRGMCQVK